MRVVVIGGTGHVGSFLVPRLVNAGHDVVSVSRGVSRPYVEDPAWDRAEQITADRTAMDEAGTFAGFVADLQPEVVIDMLCFTLESAQALVDGLRTRVDHLIHCGSIWMHGPSVRVPIHEDDDLPPSGEYGVQKKAIATMLQQETAGGGLLTTSLHPGHISGPGWPVINPIGNLDPSVWQRLANGDVLDVPGSGSELMAHVHADDVAQAFALAVEHRDRAAGQSFHVTAKTALTVRGYAQIAAGWFGREATLRQISWADFRASTSEENAEASWQHLWRSHHTSVTKAGELLGYQPAYAPEAAAKEAVRWLVDNDQIQVTTPMEG